MGSRQPGQDLQQADGPVPVLVGQRLLIQLPARQGDGQLRPLQLVLGQLLGHMHGVGAHAHGHQGVVISVLSRRDQTDIHVDVRGLQLVPHVLEGAEIPRDVLLHRLHLGLGVALHGGGGFGIEFLPVAGGAVLFQPDIEVPLHLSGGVAVQKGDLAVQIKEDSLQGAAFLLGGGPGEPAAAVQSGLLGGQPLGLLLGQARLIHTEDHLHLVTLDGAVEGAVGGVGFKILRIGGKNLVEGGKTIRIGGDAGNGAQLLVGTLVRTVLKSTVQVGIDPVVLHLFQGGTRQNLPPQGEELIVSGFQG